MKHLSTPASPHSSILLVLAVCLGGVPPSAEAQIGRVIKAPVVAAFPEVFQTGERFRYCAGAPLEWEIRIENSSIVPITVTLDDDIQAGLNGDQLAITCPPVLLPPSVDPIVDVDCDPVGQTLQIRNIVVEPCDVAFVRYRTPVSGSLIDICNGAVVSNATQSRRSVTPLDNQIPSERGDTCVFVHTMCNLSEAANVRVFKTALDENGPPLLPGDSILYRTWIDLRFLFFQPTMVDYYEHSVGRTLLPIPTFLDFTEWVTKPLEPPPSQAVYEWDSVQRTMRIYDADPAVPPDIPLPLGVETEFAQWRAQVSCDAPSGAPLCLSSVFAHAGGFLRSDDPTTYALDQDATCVTPVLPDFGNSTKNVTDADRSGDAQPGEILTFQVAIDNASPCPPELIDCWCSAKNVEVIDFVDTSKIEVIEVLDGGTLVTPDQIEWTIPQVGAAGRINSKPWLFFRARVRSDVKDGDLICNRAQVTSPELINVNEGGLFNCPTVPPTEFFLDPCIVVRIPSEPILVVDKTVGPPLVPPAVAYKVGDPVTFTISVTNAGGADATNIELWDCLDSAWDTSLMTVQNGGQVGLLPDPGCSSGSWIRWPNIPNLAQGGGKQTVTFDAVIPVDGADGDSILNIAHADSASVPAIADSNSVDVPICAPVLAIEKSLPRGLYAEGELIEWTITVTNSGSCEATSLEFRDVIDVAQVEDVPALTWTAPPGASSSFDPATKEITWSLPDLPSAGVAVFTVSSIIRSGTAPGPICNDARSTWAEGLQTLVSAPACADIETGCAAVIPAVEALLAYKGPTRDDVQLVWDSLPAATDGYNVWRALQDKTLIPAIQSPGSPPDIVNVAGCLATAPTDCVDTGAVPGLGGTIDYYQVKGICGATEGE